MNLPQLSAGSLDQLVTLQARSSGADERGQERDTWVDVATNVWARVAPRRGRDYFAAAQEQATFDCTVLLRYRTDITPAMRVLWNGQPLELVGEPVNVGGAGVYLELLCVHSPRAGVAA